jgi:hypothetical protein
VLDARIRARGLPRVERAEPALARSETPPKLNTVHGEYDEEVLTTEPFEARFTFTIGDEALTVTVGEDMNVRESRRHDITEFV